MTYVLLFCQKAESRGIFGVKASRADVLGVESSHGQTAVMFMVLLDNSLMK